jgi:GDP-4-dehydro-6-deoxy-D-mannose reductase
VCAAYIACINRRYALPPGAFFNVASGEAHRIGDVLEELRALAGVALEVRIDRSRVRATDMPLVCGNAARARDELGWLPTTPWRQTLQDVLDDWHNRVRTETG